MLMYSDCQSLTFFSVLKQQMFPTNNTPYKSIIGNELEVVARRSTNSLLMQKNYTGLCSLNLDDIVQEMRHFCPTVYDILSTMLDMDNKEKKNPTLCLVYGLIMFRRFHELSLFQRINTLILIEGNANQQVNNT